jgi:endonuclease III
VDALAVRSERARAIVQSLDARSDLVNNRIWDWLGGTGRRVCRAHNKECEQCHSESRGVTP